MTPPNPHRFSDLTIGEVKTLTKYFFTASLVCLLVFGIPYALIIGLSLGAKSLVPQDQLSWLSRAVSWLLYVFLLWLLFKDPAYTLKYFGEMFLALSAALTGVSRVKQTIGLAFFIAYFYSATILPDVWFWFTILVFLPAGFTYHQYKRVLAGREKEAS